MTQAPNFQLMHALQSVSPTLPLANMIEEVAHVYQQVMPTLFAVRFYRVARGGLSLWYSTQSAQDPNVSKEREVVSFSKVPKYHRIIDKGGLDYAPPLLIAGLRNADGVFAMLELEFPQNERLDSTALAQHALAADYLATRFDNALLRDMMARQANALKELTDCRDFADIALVLARNLTERGQFVALNIFNFDEDGLPYAVHTRATANHSQSYVMDDPIANDRASVMRLYETVSTLEGGLFVPDVANDTLLPQYSRDTLVSNKVYSFHGFPLRLAGQVIGIVAFNDTKRPIVLTPLESRTFASLVNQAATTIDNRNMLARTASDLEELRTLYELTSTLVQAQNVAQTLQVTYHMMGRSAHSVTLSNVVYDATNGTPTLQMLYRMDGREDAHEIDETLPITAPRWQAHFSQPEQPVEFVDSIASSDHPEAALLLSEGVQRFAVIPIVQEGKRIQQVTLAWRSPRPFDERIRRLITALQSQYALILQNQRLLAEAQASADKASQQAELMRAVNAITNLANTESDEVALLRYGTRILQEMTGADHVGIVLQDRNKRFFNVVAEYPSSVVEGVRLVEENKPLRLMRERRDIILIEDWNGADIDPPTLKLLQQLGVTSALFVPMLDRQGKVYGSVGLDIYGGRPFFTPERIEVARTLVSQLSLSLQKLMFYNTAQRQAKQIARVNAFGQSVQATQNLDAILDSAQDYLHQIVAFDYLAVYLYETSARALNMIRRALNDETTHFSVPQPISMEQNALVRQVWHDYEVQYVPNLSESTLWMHPLKGALESMVVLPLVAGGQALGILEIGTYNAYAHDDIDLTTLRQMASQLAVALSNAAAYARSQQQAIIKGRANDISARLQQAASIETMVRLTAEEVGRTLNARRARVRLKPLSEKEN